MYELKVTRHHIASLCTCQSHQKIDESSDFTSDVLDFKKALDAVAKWNNSGYSCWVYAIRNIKPK